MNNINHLNIKSFVVILASRRKYSPKQRPNTMVWNLARLSGSDITLIISVCIITHRDVGEYGVLSTIWNRLVERMHVFVK